MREIFTGERRSGPGLNYGLTNGAKRPQRSKIVASTSNSITDEDLICDDDDIEEALIIADKAEVKSKSRSKVRAVPGTKDQLPESANTGEPANAQTGNKRVTKRKPTPLLNPDEEYIMLEDEDETGIVDLTRAAEDTAKQAAPIPPPRERKLNMHEVNQNEDYGGALFSDAERQFLGMVIATHIVPPAFPSSSTCISSYVLTLPRRPKSIPS